MSKGKYVTLKIENAPDSLSNDTFITYDIYFKDETRHTYIGEFENKKNAILFCKIKNKEELK